MHPARTKILGPTLSILLYACGGSGGHSVDASMPSADGGAACAPGSWDSDGDPGTGCVAWTACVPGTYVDREGAADRDRHCLPCPSGTFAEQVNQASCAAFRSCEPGSFVATAGTATADRVCAACASGSFSAQADAPACTEWNTCAPGTYVDAAGTARADRACRACPDGTFSSSSNAAQCTRWTDCVTGEHVLAPGAPTSDRTCEACSSGTYSAEPNASTCLPAGTCLAGARQTAAATATSPVQCAACEPGNYCAGGGAAQVACGSGTWDDDGSAATPCAAWTDCAAGQYVASAGTARADRACAACANGDTTSAMNATSCSPGAWLLSYFGPAQDVPNDSLHLAYSLDGQHWAGLAYHRPVYQLSGLGTNHIRDPFIARKNDGSFVYLATDWTLAENDSGYWSHPSPRIFAADSADLVTFTNPRFVTVTDLPGPNGEPMHAWAPEAYYDAKRGTYAVVWSGNDSTGANRIYVSYTRDFATTSSPTPDVLFDPGYSVIDATLERAGGRTYLFFKDETDGNGAPENRGKDIQIARAPSPALDPGSFSMWSTDYVTRGAAQTVRQATEGPFAVYQPAQGRWILYADYYGNGGVFGAWTAPSLDAEPSAWTALPASEFSFPSGVRHAHAVRITRDELEALIAHYGVAHRLRTTYSEGAPASPFYVAHSWYHGIITTLDDRGRGQLPDDFLFKVVPGLADPSDASLVSFEAVGQPGRYLRIDSANPARYPSCSEGSNRSWGLCWVAAEDRHHLTWLDPYEDTAAFRGDATFRRVPALNGDASMVSLQWVADSSRYLRHMAYQVFATPVSGSTQQNDASFVIERE